MQVMSVLEELARLVLLAVEAMREAARFMSRPVESRPPSLPGRSSGPVVHVGATERFGAELRALRSIEVSPELVSDIETELRWGLIWHEFERSMQVEIDRVFAPYLAMIECRDFDDLREMIGLRELTNA